MAQSGSPTEEDLLKKVPELRKMFASEYNEQISNGSYDQRDIDRVQTDDPYLQCFIRSYSNEKLELEVPAKKLHECLLFRKEIGLNDITPEKLPEELLQREYIYWHGKDNQGHDVLLFKIVRNKKGTYVEDVKKHIAYTFEQHHKAKPGQRIVLIFDFTGAGVTNMDLDVTKFIIKSLTDYFPSLLLHILMYEMPWLLSAVWKVIRSWLNEEQKKRVIMVKQKEICEYIANDQLEPHMVKK